MRKAVFLILVLIALTLLVRVRVDPPDVAYYYAHAHSLLYDGDLLYDNQIAAFPFQPYEIYIGPEGLPANDWPIGSGLLWLIALLWTRLGMSALHLAGLSPAPTGFEEASKLAATLITSLAGLLALWIPLRHLRHKDKQENTNGAGLRKTLLIAAAAVLGTPFGYYLIIYPATSHVPSAALLACTLGAYWKWRNTAHDVQTEPKRTTWPWAVLCGLAAGYLVGIRPQNVVFGLIPLLDFFLARRQKENALKVNEILIALCAAFLAFFPQLVVWRVLYGNWLALPKIEEMHWFNPNLLPFLFSSYHGYLAWAPLCLLALIGLALRKQTWPYLAAVLAQIYVNACNEWWWAGGSFSARRMVGCTPLLVIGLWSLFAAIPSSRWKKIATWLCALCCGWTFSLLLTEIGRLIRLDHEQPWRQIVPKLPQGIPAGFKAMVPWDAIRQSPWERTLIPLWFALGILAAGWALHYLYQHYQEIRAHKAAVCLALILASSVTISAGIAGWRTPSSFQPDPDTDWVTYSRFRWVYRFEEAHLLYAHGDPWGAVDSFLAGDRIFAGFYHPWRTTGYAMLWMDYPYQAYFAFKTSITRGDRTSSIADFHELLERLLREYDSPKKAAWLNELGIMNVKLNRPQEAAEAFKRALEVNPGYFRAADNLKKCQALYGDLQSPDAEQYKQQPWNWE